MKQTILLAVLHIYTYIYTSESSAGTICLTSNFLSSRKKANEFPMIHAFLERSPSIIYLQTQTEKVI